MSEKFDVVGMLESLNVGGSVALAKVNEARALVAELLAADREYDAALARHHDAINADRDARMPLYEAYKAAEVRRRHALAAFKS